jgi:polyisoprenoid-binding protein YceI
MGDVEKMPDNVDELLEAASQPQPAKRRHRPLRWLVGAVAIIVVVVVGGPLVYFNLIEGSAPAAPTLPVGPGGATGPVNGAWKVTGGSLAEYRVQEILFGQHHTAVGKTSKVSGTMVIKGATVVSARFEVDMASVMSGQAGRDVAWRNSIMDTGPWPQGYFVLTHAVDLKVVPRSDHVVTVDAAGTLTMRGKTEPVIFPLRAERDGSKIVVDGSLPIHFARWGIPNPTWAVAQVGSVGTIAMLLRFTRS